MVSWKWKRTLGKNLGNMKNALNLVNYDVPVWFIHGNKYAILFL